MSSEKGGDAVLHVPQKVFESIERQIIELQEENVRLRKEANSYKQKVDQLTSDHERTIKSLRERYQQVIKNLEGEIARLNEEIKSCRGPFDRLMISQVACLFEQAICSYVLPEVYNEKNKFASIPELLNYLNDSRTKLPRVLVSEDDSERVLQQARQKWKHLCHNVFEFKDAHEWESKTGQSACGHSLQNNATPTVIKAIGWLKRNRVPVAHPEPVVLKDAEKVVVEMGKYYYKSKFPIIKDFITSIETMLQKERKLMHQSLI